jgi:hypothetical protein
LSIAFLLTTLVVVATPGTGAVYSIAAGLSRGSRAGIIAAFGCTLGVLPHMVAAITGLAAILHASAIAFQAIKWLGVAYLLYLAWQTLRDQSAIQVDDNRAPVSFWRVIRTAVLINLLNPKLTIFFFAFLPQFVPAGQPNGQLADGGPERCVDGAHVRRVRPLRRIRGDGADPGDQPPQSHVVAAPHICRHLPPARRSPGRPEPITNAVHPLTAAARPVPPAIGHHLVGH